ncbi:InlB B-repeat-containing protein [Lachnoclostridium sp. MSJ-17]|uniref:InlB B-repeat-containing protein n=1 Tax=Lachnoclostridium sp. MSJ-17 TaxID=2841516 RepID=UPI001C121483|nr:InlB B-repeat-containing protein [Lachnoclostridium sp. MSJ-17]MBU5462258.1 InlB B-repeat-containing protein [Lachnoclostridium sp. MSJ-17]
MGMLKKPMSILLPLLMIVSLFTIVPFPVGAESAVYTLTVENFEPSPTNDYDENIALETKIDGSVTEGTSHSVQSGTQISVTARLGSNGYPYHVTGMTMTYLQDGETKTTEAELEILDAYRNVRAVFTMPPSDARISFKVDELHSVQVSGSADGTVTADRIRAYKGDAVNVTVTPTNSAKPCYKLYATYEWDTDTRQLEIINNSSFVMPAGSDVRVYAEFFDSVAAYIERSWDGEKVVAKERIRTPDEGYISMSSVADGSTLQGGSWYYVNSDVAFKKRVHTDGEVHIILGDGATVDFKRGLEVSEGDTLNVYDQKQGTGRMIAFCERFAQRDDQDEAAIGGDKGLDGGSMNFYGGNFEATTKRETRGAAIGGSGFRAGGRMIFYAGNYIVKSRFGSSTGIGGGYKGEASRCSGEGITIYGGTFDIQTFQSGAGIGSGEGAYRSTGAIAIYGGSITASSHNGGAAIGGGKNSENGPIYIYGGEVNAVAYGNKIGAGIGGGQDAEQGDPIYISGGTVVSQSDKGAGIGGGMGKGGGYIEISGGLVVATSTAGGAGIGGGRNGSNHIVNITGGYVIAASSSYTNSSEMMEMVTRYLGNAPMGSQYQRSANAMMVSVAALVDLFSSDEELSGAGIGGGHGGSGGEVNIFGGIVIAKCGLSSANAIGKGKGGSDSGTLTLDNKTMVSAGSDDNNAQMKKKDERLSSCRNCKFAEIRPCGFSHTNYTIIDEYSHKTTCEYCEADQDLDLHEYDASGLTCTLCGYQRIKVSFDPGDGSGTMEDVYLSKGETYTLPKSAFTPPENKYFSGWRGTIGSTTDVFVPGATFKLNESVTLTAEYGETYQLWVGGVQVTDANRNDVFEDGKVSFDPETCVLNLDGVTMLPGINSSQRSMIYANRMNLTVTGSGDLTSGQMFSNGIYVNIGSLTLDGDFSVTGSQGNGFYASKDILITGGAITAQAKSYGIRAGRRLYLYDGITRVSADAEQQRTLFYDDIFVDPSLLVTAYSPEDALRPDGSFYYNYTKHLVIERGAVITYKLNGGTMDGQTDEVKSVLQKNTTVAEPEPVRDGYSFDGWYTDDQYGSLFDFDDPVTEDITLYAKWTQKPLHTISMSDMAGGYVYAPVEAYEGQTVRVYPHEEYGYDLEHFSYTTDSGEETEITGVDYSFSFIMPDDNVTLNAVFRGGEYQIRIDEGVPAGAIEAPASARAGEKVSVTVNGIDGKHLAGVTVKDAEAHNVSFYSDSHSFTMPLSDVTINAEFEAHSFEDPTWTWDGHDSATADFRCSVCDFERSLTAQGDAITYETTTEPTYTTEGERVYTASVTMNGVTYTSDITETIEKASRIVEVTYLNLNGEEKTVTATRIVGDETDLESGWYAVVDSVTNNNRISNNGKVHGGVNLILCDGAIFTNPEGMSVNGARSLTVWGQSAGTGTWNITKPPTSCAGIGGYINASGNITINGGVINVTGAQNAAGIGAGGFAPDSQGVITINGGTVNAKGGHSGAGIGGGNADNSYAGRVVINGGNVTATGNSRGAGIGSGRQSYADVIISGGTVKAVEGNFASVGIGGSGSTVTLTYTDDVSITSTGYDGTVTLEQPFTDGTNVFEAGVVDDNSVLAGTTLRPSGGIGVRLAGHSISLDGDIAVNFYMELSDSVIAHKDTAYMHFTVPNGNGTTEQTMLVKDALIKEWNGKNYYVFKCRVAAKEMTSQIKAQIIDAGMHGTEYTYSVKDYADYLLEHADEREDLAKAVPLVKAMLNYGARAQIYFDKNPADLANASLSEEEKALGEVTVTAPESAIGLPDGVSFEGATLSLKSETTLSLYFESAKALTFECEEKNVETVTSGKYQIARIRGIKAKELKKTFTLTVKDGEEIIGTITYSPMTYCSNVLSDGTQSEALQNVCKALYLYAKAADSYFPD